MKSDVLFIRFDSRLTNIFSYGSYNEDSDALRPAAFFVHKVKRNPYLYDLLLRKTMFLETLTLEEATSLCEKKVLRFVKS